MTRLFPGPASSEVERGLDEHKAGSIGGQTSGSGEEMAAGDPWPRREVASAQVLTALLASAPGSIATAIIRVRKRKQGWGMAHLPTEAGTGSTPRAGSWSIDT